MNSFHVFLAIIAFTIDKHTLGGRVTGNNVDRSARGQHCCPCPQNSPSEQHMLTMISKDVCWAVSKAIASLSSSLPLWTKTTSHVSQHPTKTITVITVITHLEFSYTPQRRDFFQRLYSNISSGTF